MRIRASVFPWDQRLWVGAEDCPTALFLVGPGAGLSPLPGGPPRPSVKDCSAWWWFTAVLPGASEASWREERAHVWTEIQVQPQVPQVPHDAELPGPYTGGHFEGTEHFRGVAIAMVTARLQQPANIFQES